MGEKLREREAATGLLFCRHGDTDYPDDCFYLSPPEIGSEGDPALNPRGRGQADRLGKYLSGLGEVSALYASPTLRTCQTAESAQSHLGGGISLLVAPGLLERSMGEWEGRSAGEIREQDPEGWKRWKTELLSFCPPGGESLTDFGRRIGEAVKEILEKEAGRMVAVLTHVGSIRAATASAPGMPLENGKRLVIPPGSVTRLHYTRSWPNLILLGYRP